jgi:hypothetical protein
MLFHHRMKSQAGRFLVLNHSMFTVGGTDELRIKAGQQLKLFLRHFHNSIQHIRFELFEVSPVLIDHHFVDIAQCLA